MKKRLTYVSPLQVGKVLAALYFLLSLLFVIPMLLFGGLAAALTHNMQPPNPSFHQNVNPVFGLLFGGIGIIIFPVIYTAFGFIFGVLGAAVYNLVAKWTGGIEFVVTDVPPDTAPPTLPSSSYAPL